MGQPFLRRYRFPLSVWAGLTALMVSLQHVSSRVLRDPRYQLWPLQGWEFFFGGWKQFDGPEYLKIAANGYRYVVGERSNIVWFPVYPLTVRFAHVLVRNWLMTGIVVSAVFGVVAAVLLWRWLEVEQLDGRARRMAFLAAMLYPYAWYLYGVVHSDSMFLALVLGCFLLIEADRLLLAGVVGAFATATRPTGMALIPAAVVLAWERAGFLAVPADADGATGWWSRLVQRWQLPVQVVRARWSARLAAPLLVCAGLGTWMLYLWVRWGDPLAFKTNQQVYHPGNLPLLKRAFFVRWRDFTDSPSYTLTITLQALLALVVLLSIPAVARRFGWGYAVFIGVLVAIPTVSTEDFMGTGRYMIAAFPAWAMWGERWSTQRRGWWPLAVSGCVMVLLSAGFARSWYLT
ncbi:MAG: hypothetical protein ACKOYM_02320 [Actinomycetes bacterium]